MPTKGECASTRFQRRWLLLSRFLVSAARLILPRISFPLLPAFVILAFWLFACFGGAGQGKGIHFGIPQAQAEVNYVYDELGRLTGVLDPVGNSATYTYDAAGNIVSISRQNASQVSIIEFTPNSGPVGTLVTIFGTGFSTTATQNTVTFNGVAATVTSSSANEIVAQVPAEATTGLISVTTPNGAATSSTPFTVGSGNAPTITSFTPTIGAAGTTVSITGTKFDAVPAKDKVTFNTNIAAIATATTTNITTNVPATSSSGKIAVTTLYGKAVSNQDFYVPPSPYTAADIEVTGRMAIGDSKTVTISTAGKIGMILFDGTGGQRATLNLTSTSFTSYCVNLTIINPNGTNLASGCFGGTGTVYDPALSLPTTGTYTIVIDPTSTEIGSLTFTLAGVPPDATGMITIDGADATLSTTAAWQNGRLTFNGTAGQRITLTDVSHTYPSGINVYIFKPGTGGGTSITNGNIYFAGMNPGYWTDTLTLPASGTYTIFIDPHTTETGSATLRLRSVPADATGTITVDGPDVTVTTTGAGQNASLTFSGTAGQQMTLTDVSHTYPSGIIVTIYKPAADGTASTTNGNIYFAGWNPGYWTDALTLPASGTYTIFINPQTTETGSATFRLRSVPADVTGTITVDGGAVTVSTTAAGQNAALTFSGTAGQRVSLTSSGSTYPSGATIYMYKPAADGTASTSNGTVIVISANYYSDVLTLPITGVYTLLVDPPTTTTGSVTLNLVSVPADVTGTITVDGGAVTVSTTAAGQNAKLTFSGTAGQRVSLTSSGSTYPSGATIYMYKPAADGTASTSNGTVIVISANYYSDVLTLPITGVYTLLVDPPTTTTGSVTLNLVSVPADVTGTITVDGGAVTVSTTAAGQNAALTFSGTAGQRVSLTSSGSTYPSGATIYMYKPAADGTASTSNGYVTAISANTSSGALTLPTTGIYTIYVNPPGTTTGSLTVSVTSS